MRVGSVHALCFEIILSSSKYFSFIRLSANAPPTADKNPIEIASRRNNLIIFFSMVVFFVWDRGREPESKIRVFGSWKTLSNDGTSRTSGGSRAVSHNKLLYVF